MENKLFALLMSLTLLGFLSCSDFIEEDLSKRSIVIMAPADNITSSLLTQTFKWETLKGAEEYNLQIVKPDFSNIQEFIVDSTIRSSQFIYTLRPGTYQWKIRAQNGSSTTEYVTYNLTIDSTQDLAYQQLMLLTPTNNEYVGTMTQKFTWGALSSATNYVFQVFTSSNASVPGSLQSVTTNTASFTFTSQGAYKWRVFAQNSTSVSPYKEFTINVDTVRPAKPVVISPKNDTTLIASPVSLKWNSVTLATAYHVQVTSDTIFSASNMQKDTTLTNTTLNFYQATVAKDFYWRVKSIRNVNESPYSLWWSFRRN